MKNKQITKANAATALKKTNVVSNEKAFAIYPATTLLKEAPKPTAVIKIPFAKLKWPEPFVKSATTKILTTPKIPAEMPSRI